MSRKPPTAKYLGLAKVALLQQNLDHRQPLRLRHRTLYKRSKRSITFGSKGSEGAGGVEPPAFEEIYGYPQNAILTRVERQMAAGRVPPTLDTDGKLRNSRAFNPI